ncbi:cell division protein FtsA [Candidatus Microgenomates bacterium]|nr:cell division protein FtsA [Candidatus Microgenomates bacterium]
MAKNEVVVGIDVGTSKVVTIVASISNEEKSIIGVSSVPSKGIKKGQVVDIEETTGPILESLEAAERMAGYSVSSAFISVGGVHIKSQNSHGVVAVAEPKQEITENDILRVVEAAKAISLPSSYEIIHVLPRGFIVDGQEGILDPVGMTGVRLEVDTHLVMGGGTSLRNLEKCVGENGVDISGFVFGGLASSEAVLSPTEKELGVVVVDIGAGTTDIAIYIEGALSYSTVIPVGAKNVTNDLAIGLRVSLDSAEKIKLFLGEKKEKKVLPSEKEKNKKIEEEEVDLTSLELPEKLRKISRKTLIEGIIKPRLDEIFTMVGLQIKKSGFGGMTPAGIVITGGGAKTAGALESAKRNLAMPARIGIPQGITGLVDEILAPSFSTAVGLIVYGVKAETKEKGVSFSQFGKFFKKIPVKGVAKKFLDLAKSFLP